MAQLGKYNAKEIEAKWQKYWEENGTFKFDKNLKNKENYIVDTPPPTVSGNMHIGHAVSYSQQDFIVRYQRMIGKNVFYPFGTDDNGLPTERLVEKLNKVKSTRMQRSDFIELCQKTLKEIKPDFIKYWKNIGMSCDFSSSYSTIGKHAIKTSQKSFLDLYKKGLINQKEAPSMWCVNCQTAIAQAELEDKELSSTFNDIKFKIKETGEDIIIGTTRPELLPACVCIFVNPKDERYKHLVSKTAIVPLFGQEVPIFEDESAEIDKGSGILMICSYGDRFDVDAIKRKNLEPRVCINKYGKLNALAKDFEGLKIKNARTAILEKLDEEKLLLDKKSINHIVNVHDKCGTEIEFLASKQWFIKILESKQKFLDAGSKIKWNPSHMQNRYNNWVENLNWDWSISRQRHFGVPFPVWFDKDGKVVVASEEELPVDPEKDVPKGYNKEDLTPEMDVMDTWATSSVTPQIIANWVEGDPDTYDVDFKDAFPATLRPQGHDIIRTWAFYTIVKSIYHHNKIPWKEINIAGMVADPKGEKMSKSKGNVIDPTKVIDKYSADALRYWAASSKLGDDLNYYEKDLLTGKKTINKIWNASNFVFMHLEDYKGNKPENLEFMDKWMLTKLNKIIGVVTDFQDKYEYNRALSEADVFFKHTFCDYYLEIVKDRLYNPDTRGSDQRLSAQYVLNKVLLASLKMYAPVLPHVTEELYQFYFKEKSSIHISKWPTQNIDEIFEDEEIGNKIIEIIAEVRKFKSENAISLKEELSKITIHEDELVYNKILEAKDDIKATTRAKEIDKAKKESDELIITIDK